MSQVFGICLRAPSGGDHGVNPRVQRPSSAGKVGPAVPSRHAAVAAFMLACIGLRETAVLGADGQLPLLSAYGTQWANERGERVILRGVNLGNWLIQEMWMHNAGMGGIPDQYTLEGVLRARFGEAAKDALLNAYRDNYISERDFAIIRAFGMNVVRLPFVYTLLEDDENPFVLKPDAWVYLDRAIDMAEAAGLYTILDMHGAPGRQSAYHHTGRADFNRLFFEPVYQDRTVWLWRQIAARYRSRGAVAAYDILNEPWGSSKAALRSLAFRIYDAIRAADPDHVIVLPGYWDGFEFYGRPADQGMTDVAYTMHFYPGFFGWGEPTVATHRDWLTAGVLDWRDRVNAHGVPFLVGEMNVVLKGAGGGEMMRHSFDIYDALGWGTAMWSYKVFTAAGGIRDGIWGMVTNPPGTGAPRIAANTWSCDDWDCTFAEACVHNFTGYSPPGTGPVAVYLLVKAGTCCGGQVDVVFDIISLRDDATGEELVRNGGFGSSAAWTAWTHAGDITIDFSYTGDTPRGGAGPALRLRGADFSNGGAYQALRLEGGRVYTLGGAFRDIGSTPQAAWAEVYLRTDRPVPGIDHAAGPIPGNDIDLNTSSYEEILGYFRSLAWMDYVIDDDLRHWLTTDEEPGLFTPPDIEERFRRADANADGRKLDLGDGIFVLQYLFVSGPPPPCLDAADANDDNRPIDLGDGIYILQHLFAAGPAIPWPYPDCGIDPTVDELDCRAYPPCDR